MSVNASRTLLERFWILKDREKDLYYKTKEGLETAARFAREYPGWRLINNERILKLEKVPAHAEPFMGITDFSDRQDYALFCALLIFLEDLEDTEAFLLSELVTEEWNIIFWEKREKTKRQVIFSWNFGRRIRRNTVQ